MSDITERLREFEQDNDGVPSPYELLGEAADIITDERELADDAAVLLEDEFNDKSPADHPEVVQWFVRWRKARGL